MNEVLTLINAVFIVVAFVMGFVLGFAVGFRRMVTSVFKKFNIIDEEELLRR